MAVTADELLSRLRQNPGDAAAFGHLRAHYEDLRDYASLASLLEGWAARSSDPDAAATAFTEAADFAVQTLGDSHRGISLLERALERSPMHNDAFVRLQQLLEHVGEIRRLTDVLERRAQALAATQSDPRHIGAIYHRLGELWETRLQRMDRAISYYRKAYEMDSALVAAIYSAREIYRQAGNLKAAAALYELEANAETDPIRKVALLRELAHARATSIGDVEGAISALRRALTMTPGDLNVMHELALVLLQRADAAEQSPESTTDGEPEASRPTDADRRQAADILYQMAQHVPAEHGIAYAEAALDAVPDHDGAIQLLERLTYELGMTDRLPGRWVAYLQVAPDAPGSRDMRHRLGDAYIQVGQIEDAIACFEPLVAAHDTRAAQILMDLYHRTGREPDVAQVMVVAIRDLPKDQRVRRLRELMDSLLERGDRIAARIPAREIFEIDPSNGEALAYLEDEYRKEGNLVVVRDLMLSAARIQGLSVEARKQRMREVATLSETELDDIDAAIGAYRAIVALDPADAYAREALKSRLEKMQRWEDLAQVLEREALALTEPDAKIAIYRTVAELHRRELREPAKAIGVLRALRELDPEDAWAREELGEALLEAEMYPEAVVLLRERIDVATDTTERLKLLRTLADVLERHLKDETAAFEASTRVLDIAPDDVDALERMARIDERNGRYERLIETLSYRAEISEGSEQAELLRRIARLSDESLEDLDRSAEYYRRALEIEPTDMDTLNALASVYERADRFRDLIVLLRDRAAIEEDSQARAELYRRVARILADQVGNEKAAAEAWKSVLDEGDDEEALRCLLDVSEDDEPEERADLLDRLARLVDTRDEKRELLLERATILAERLDRKVEAIEVLQYVTGEVDREHVLALARLADLCADVGDSSSLAEALEQQLHLVEEDTLRVPIAAKLADIYENDMPNATLARAALQTWAEADLTEPEPQRRLAGILEAEHEWDELVRTLDSLAGIEQSDDAVSNVVRRSAEITLRKLGDANGAWNRLQPRVEDGDEQAENMLRAVAMETGRGQDLAELYVKMARAAQTDEVQKQHWLRAAGVCENFLEDSLQALEATLRALALSMSDWSLLDEVDRLAKQTGAWPRLEQVYDTLLRHATETADKVELLMRHADLLDRFAGESSPALDQAIRACALVPLDDAVLERTEELALKTERGEELLILYERRRARAEDIGTRVDTLLRAARLCFCDLHDRERAEAFVIAAIKTAGSDADELDRIEDMARDIDAAAQDDAEQSGQRLVAAAYENVAQVERGSAAGIALRVRTARLFEDVLSDEEKAFRTLLEAAGHAPGDEDLLDTLVSFSERHGRLELLEVELGRLVEEALDPRTAVGLLRRRGSILDNDLKRASEAADVYSRLINLNPSDRDVPALLSRCLREASRFHDLLLILDRELTHTSSVDAKVTVLRQIAFVWENELKNRYEAIDAWRKVLVLSPGDAEASAAVQRLGHSARRTMADEVALLGVTEQVIDQPALPEPVTAAAPVKEDKRVEEAVATPSSEPPSEPPSEPALKPASASNRTKERVEARRSNDESTENEEDEPSAVASAPIDDETVTRPLDDIDRYLAGSSESDSADSEPPQAMSSNGMHPDAEEKSSPLKKAYDSDPPTSPERPSSTEALRAAAAARAEALAAVEAEAEANARVDSSEWVVDGEYEELVSIDVDDPSEDDQGGNDHETFADDASMDEHAYEQPEANGSGSYAADPMAGASASSIPPPLPRRSNISEYETRSHNTPEERKTGETPIPPPETT